MYSLFISKQKLRGVTNVRPWQRDDGTRPWQPTMATDHGNRIFSVASEEDLFFYTDF